MKWFLDIKFAIILWKLIRQPLLTCYADIGGYSKSSEVIIPYGKPCQTKRSNFCQNRLKYLVCYQVLICFYQTNGRTSPIWPY